jgi:hypothetical protein
MWLREECSFILVADTERFFSPARSSSCTSTKLATGRRHSPGTCVPPSALILTSSFLFSPSVSLGSNRSLPRQIRHNGSIHHMWIMALHLMQRAAPRSSCARLHAVCGCASRDDGTARDSDPGSDTRRSRHSRTCLENRRRQDTCTYILVHAGHAMLPFVDMGVVSVCTCASSGSG